MQTKTKTEKIFYRQIHKIQKCILQIDIQNTNIQIAKMHNADKLKSCDKCKKNLEHWCNIMPYLKGFAIRDSQSSRQRGNLRSSMKYNYTTRFVSFLLKCFVDHLNHAAIMANMHAIAIELKMGNICFLWLLIGQILMSIWVNGEKTIHLGGSKHIHQPQRARQAQLPFLLLFDASIFAFHSCVFVFCDLSALCIFAI